MSKIRPYILSENNWSDIRDRHFQLAILPWGATEAHNFHLPYGTDQYLADQVAERVAGISWERGGRVLVLPSIGYGVNTGQMDIPFCMNMNPSTQLMLLRDIAEVLSNHQVHKLMILNAHGGNSFKQMIRELSVSFPELFICSVDWWKSAKSDSIFKEAGDHAGELETSAMMYLFPELVLPLEKAGRGQAKKFKLDALNKGWAVAQREWTRVTEDTGSGDPSASNAEKGKAFLEATVAAIADFTVELAGLGNHDLYE